MPRYFLDLPEDSHPRRFELREPPPERKDTAYWSAVLREMERTVADPEIDVYLTYSPRALPQYGHNVVAVVLGDEGALIPRYADRVRSVFKCYGTHPVLGAGPLANPSLTGVCELAQTTARWLRWLPGGAAHWRVRTSRSLRGQPPPPPIAPVPLGTFNQLDLPLRPTAERGTDIFFAGSVEQSTSALNRLLSPKTRARHDMLAAIEQLRADRPELRVAVRLTRDFQASEQASATEYSQAMMDARICLAPRGTSGETFRLLEGLRSGCVVVSDRLPDHWFYRGAPIIQLNRWSELQRSLATILDDSRALQDAQMRALNWWRDCCCEAAVGRYMAEHLNLATQRFMKSTR